MRHGETRMDTSRPTWRPVAGALSSVTGARNRFQVIVFICVAASAVAEEMALLKRAGVEHIWFGDDVLALNHSLGERVRRRSHKAGIAAIPFKVQSRADLMREDTELHLKAAGCAEVWMGVESGSGHTGRDG